MYKSEGEYEVLIAFIIEPCKDIRNYRHVNQTWKSSAVKQASERVSRMSEQVIESMNECASQRVSEQV